MSDREQAFWDGLVVAVLVVGLLLMALTMWRGRQADAELERILREWPTIHTPVDTSPDRILAGNGRDAP